MSRRKYKEYPKGCGEMTTGHIGDKVVDLDLMLTRGTRAQRRFALRELKKLNKSRGN